MSLILHWKSKNRQKNRPGCHTVIFNTESGGCKLEVSVIMVLQAFKKYCLKNLNITVDNPFFLKVALHSIFIYKATRKIIEFHLENHEIRRHKYLELLFVFLLIYHAAKPKHVA